MKQTHPKQTTTPKKAQRGRALRENLVQHDSSGPLEVGPVTVSVRREGANAALAGVPRWMNPYSYEANPRRLDWFRGFDEAVEVCGKSKVSASSFA